MEVKSSRVVLACFPAGPETKEREENLLLAWPAAGFQRGNGLLSYLLSSQDLDPLRRPRLASFMLPGVVGYHLYLTDLRLVWQSSSSEKTALDPHIQLASALLLRGTRD